VALHRAVAVARRHPQARVVLTTFSKALANALRLRLRTLIGNEPDVANRIAVHPVAEIGYELFTVAFGQPNIAPAALIETLLRQAATEVEGHRFSPRFLIGEWREVVDAWQLRVGRTTAMSPGSVARPASAASSVGFCGRFLSGCERGSPNAKPSAGPIYSVE
jgi:hypothetical protein